jgi:hypothetical protein
MGRRNLYTGAIESRGISHHANTFAWFFTFGKPPDVSVPVLADGDVAARERPCDGKGIGVTRTEVTVALPCAGLKLN